jgi:hypothetical protein
LPANLHSDYVCNWLGGEVIADMVGAPGYSAAGFVNISTSDSIVHGQVKQSELFSFVRFYESGHEVPFYQPLAALEVFARALNQTDIATPEVKVAGGYGAYKTVGTPTSDYKEGNAPSNASYNTALNAPDPTPTWAVPVEGKRSLAKRAIGRKGVSKGWKRLAW